MSPYMQDPAWCRTSIDPNMRLAGASVDADAKGCGTGRRRIDFSLLVVTCWTDLASWTWPCDFVGAAVLLLNETRFATCGPLERFRDGEAWCEKGTHGDFHFPPQAMYRCFDRATVLRDCVYRQV